MEARSQLRHRPTIEAEYPKLDETIRGSFNGLVIFAHITAIVNAGGFFCLFPQATSAIIDRAPHLHNLSNTI
jgi:hypothetical protein